MPKLIVKRSPAKKIVADCCQHCLLAFKWLLSKAIKSKETALKSLIKSRLLRLRLLVCTVKLGNKELFGHGKNCSLLPIVHY